MKIVVLDGYTLNPGDLEWKGLEQLGEVSVFDRTAPQQVVERAEGAGIVLTNKVEFDAAVMARLPELKYIGVTATGVNIVDLQAARERGIAVTNVPGYSTASVAQMVFALLLEITQQVGHHSHLVKSAGRWSASPDFCFRDRPLIELDGLTLGLVGFGQIGRRVAEIARAFGMDVHVHTAHPEKYRQSREGGGVRFVDLDTLFGQSDVISLHCPLTEQTQDLVDAKRLQQMKPGAILINTGRGPLIDEQAVADALSDSRLAGFGADVLSAEPPAEDNPLLAAPNAFITPHIAWATKAARLRLMAIAVDNVAAFLKGEAKNVVN